VSGGPDPVARAETLFLEGYACSQAVAMAFASRLGLTEAGAAGAASAFGGGMARNGWTCGAVTGAMIAIGLHAGNRTPDGMARKDDTYARVNALFARFVAAHGATDCRVLTGCEMSSTTDRQRASEAGVFRTVCPALVRTAASFVLETLEQPPVDGAVA
jgi:C_GCAxxG_C_C family probable redox protein